MASIKSIKLENFRCLANTGYINIRPITILVGKNSAGKSTFARVFPLLRQSAEEEKRAPILWYGRFVDFGSFQTTLNKNSLGQEIKFGLNTTHNLIRLVGAYLDYRPFWYRLYRDEEGEGVDVNLEMSLQQNPDDLTYASSVTITIFGSKCQIIFGNNAGNVEKIIINEFVWKPPSTIRTTVTQGRILPLVSFYGVTANKDSDIKLEDLHLINPLFDSLLKQVKKLLFHSNTGDITIRRVVNRLRLGTRVEILDALKKMRGITPTFQGNVKKLESDARNFTDICNLMFAAVLPELLARIDEGLSKEISGVRYIEPLRASASRYYRRQELAVDEIDSKGGNVAMFVDSLNDEEKNDLNSWLSRYFSVELFVEKEGGHLTLSLKENTSSSNVNLADLGVGFSQLLPIVLQLWVAAKKTQARKSQANNALSQFLLVIEQPELHLHPAHQAKIADVFFAAISEAKVNNRDISIVAETHSPSLINRLGEMISEGLLSKDDVNIVMFDQENSNKNARVTTTEFDADGVLINWPFGFFDA